MATSDPRAIHPDTIAQAFAPPAALQDGLLCVIHRDTRGCDLNPLQRFTYGTATSNMTITWYWQGSPESLSTWAPDDLTAPRVPLRGPIRINGGTTRPWIGYSPEPCHMLVAIFRPDAMRQWFGLDPQDWVDQSASLDDLPEDLPWVRWVRDIQSAGHPDIALPLLYEGLLAGRSARARKPAKPRTTAQWIERVLTGLRTGQSEPSLRTSQRKTKRMVGLSERTVRKLARLESLTVSLGEQVVRGAQPRLGTVAPKAGFYDQAQMSRDMKEVAGFSTAEAIRRTLSDESFWVIRAFYSLYVTDRASPPES